MTCESKKEYSSFVPGQITFLFRVRPAVKMTRVKFKLLLERLLVKFKCFSEALGALPGDPTILCTFCDITLVSLHFFVF